MNADSDLTIAAAQSASVRGDVEQNVATHLRFIEAAESAGIDLLVFPELSLTGYELDVADRLQLEPDDWRIAPLRRAAQEHEMHVIVGGPWASGLHKPYLGAFLLSPAEPVCYAKIHVHESELPYFVSGTEHRVVPVGGIAMGLAICADTSHAAHAAAAAERGAAVYVASIMKTPDEFSAHAQRLQQYAARHSMAVLTANYAGSSGGAESAGRSAIWDEHGVLVAQASSNEAALVIGRRAKGRWHGEVIAQWPAE